MAALFRRRMAAPRFTGSTYKLRKALEDRGVFHVLAVPMNQHVIAKTTASVTGVERRADELIAALPATVWRTRSTGNGSKVTAAMAGLGHASTVHAIPMPSTGSWPGAA